LQSYLRKYNRSSVLNQLNQIYSEQSSELETELAKIQLMSLKQEDW
jgi:hypothetical protein